MAESARRAARGKPAVISPIALEAVKPIDLIFDIERETLSVTWDAGGG